MNSVLVNSTETLRGIPECHRGALGRLQASPDFNQGNFILDAEETPQQPIGESLGCLDGVTKGLLLVTIGYVSRVILFCRISIS